MRDPLNWSIPLGRLFGVSVRMHVLLPLVMLGLFGKVAFAKDAPTGIAIDVLAVLGLMLLSIILHEFGHVAAARRVDGTADEVLLWPLGGLALCDVPHSPKAHLITTLGGPLVTLLLAAVSAAGLYAGGVTPPWDVVNNGPYIPKLVSWHDGSDVLNREWYLLLLARLFWINSVGLLLNLIPAYPLDGGQALQNILWWRTDYRSAMVNAAYIGFGAMFILAIVAVATESVLLIALAWFVYVNCKQQIVGLESASEDGAAGYDFSAGYTSLEREQSTRPKRPQPNFIQRWLQKRAVQRAKKEQVQKAAEERRMDELLDKVQRLGKQSLNGEEQRFLERVSARLRRERS